MKNIDLSIDKSKPIPAYFQIEEYIHEMIECNNWAPGTQLPTEKELCDQLGISRSVVRQAINGLVNQGLVYTVPGKGTFVSKPKITESILQSLSGFYKEVVDVGLTPQTQVLEQKKVSPPTKIARLLEISNGELVYYIVRLRGVKDGDPLSLSTTYIPVNLAPQLANEDLSEKSLYALLKSYGIEIDYADRILEAQIADKKISELLKIEIGSPILKMINISFSKEGKPIEYFTAVHSGVRSRFYVRGELS